MSEDGPNVSNMKKHKNIPATIHPRPISQSRSQSHAPRIPLADAATVATEVMFAHSDTIEALQSIMRHPRSLNRDIANWRPPIKQLPRVIDHGELTASISRFRVGPRAMSRIHGYGERRKPAYLIRLRITDPTGFEIRPEIAEGWVRALIPPHAATAVHEIPSGQAITFVWMVDREYQPLRSPSSMFAGLDRAA